MLWTRFFFFSCRWQIMSVNEDSPRWLGFVFAAQKPGSGDLTGSADTLQAEGFSQSGENL